MAGVASAVEEAVVQVVTVKTCGEVLRWSATSGGGWGGGGQLSRAVLAAQMLALDRWGEVCQSAGFKTLSEDEMCDLVADDHLAAEEEAVLEGVVEWIKGGQLGVRHPPFACPSLAYFLRIAL